MDIEVIIAGAVAVLLAAFGLFKAIAKLTPTPKDDEIAERLAKVLEGVVKADQDKE